jgi:hypothetical protein
MDTQRLKKYFYLTGLYLVSVPLTAAQTIGGNQGIEASLLEFMSTILVFEIESVQGVLLYFLAPIAGFYFIQKNMLSYGFELFEERIDRNSYGRTDDDIPNGIKGLSIITSFITVQMLGRISTSILFATALLSILLGALMQFGLFQGLGGGSSSSSSTSTSSSSNNTNTQRSSQTQSSSSGSGVDWSKLGQTAGNFVNNVQQNQQNRQNQGIKDALSVFSSGTDVIKLVDKEPSDFRNHVQDIRNARKGDASDVNSLEEIMDRMKHIENELENELLDAAKDDLQDTTQAANMGGGSILWEWGSDSEIRSKVDGWGMVDQLTNFNEELKRIKNDQKNNVGTLEDQLDASWDDIQVYIKIHKFAENLPGGPKNVATDNDLLNRLVSEASNRSQLNSRGTAQAKSDFKAVLEKIDRFEQAHKTLISDFESELEKELKLDKTEVEDLKKISSDDDKIRTAANRTKQLIEQIESNYGGGGTPEVDLSTGSPSPSQVKNQMDRIKDLGDEIDNHIQDIHSVVQTEGNFENESYKKLNDLK